MYIPDINESDYLTGDGEPLSKKFAKAENTILDSNIFLIKEKITGLKKCPSINNYRKLAKIGFSNWVLKKYNSYLEDIL